MVYAQMAIKFEVKTMLHKPTAKYPYNCRIQLIDCDADEYENILIWINQISNVKCGSSDTGLVIYLSESDAVNFTLKWS